MSPNSATLWTRPRVRSVSDWRALIDPATGNLDVLRLQRAGDVGDREVVRAQPIGVQPDVDLALASAEHQHLADAAHAFELTAKHLVRVFGDVPDGPTSAQRRRSARARRPDPTCRPGVAGSFWAAAAERY